MLHARALAESGATPSEKAARGGGRPWPGSTTSSRTTPTFRDAYQALAEVHLKAGERPSAVAALKDDLQAIPDDAGAAGQLVQLLSRTPAGRPSTGARPTWPRRSASPARSPPATPRGP